MTRSHVIPREEEPESPFRHMLIATLIGVIAAGAVCAGVWQWRERQARREAVAAAERAEVERQQRIRRAAQEAAHASDALLAAIDCNLFPTPEELSAASRSFAAAHALDPASSAAAAGARLVSGVGLLLDGRSAQAEPLLKEACLAKDDLLGRYFYGQMLLASARPADAWGHFDQLLRRRPGWAPALCGRGLADLQTGDFSKAAAALKTVVERYPAHPDLAGAYGVCLDEMEQRTAAAEWFGKAVAQGSVNPRVVERLGPLLLEQDRPAEASTVLSELVEKLPGAATLRSCYASALAEIKDEAAAEREFARAREIEPQNLEVLTRYAQYRLERHQTELALELLVTGQGFAADDPRLLFYLGHTRLALNEREVARDSFARSCSLGYPVACEEACYQGDWGSCNSIPGDRRATALAELGRRGMSRGYASYNRGASGSGGSRPSSSDDSTYANGMQSRASSGRRAQGSESNAYAYQRTQQKGRIFTVGWHPRDSSEPSSSSPTYPYPYIPTTSYR